MKRFAIPLLSLLAGILVNLGHLCIKAGIIYSFLFYILAVLFFPLSMLCTLLAYRLGGKLSAVFSLMAASLLINYPLSAYFFNEQITRYHWIGLFILLCGTILLIRESS